jgi:hypothetical protein
MSTVGKVPGLRIAGLSFSCRQMTCTAELEVVNKSDHPWFAISTLRRLAYDPQAQKLTLFLSEHEAPDWMGHRRVAKPAFLTIAPATSGNLTVTLPRRLAGLKAVGTYLGAAFEGFDLGDAAQVEVEIAYAGVPFYHDPARGSYLEQLARWGRIVRRRARLVVGS